MEFRLLANYIFLSFGVQAGAQVLTSLEINNLFLSHVYAAPGFAVLAGFYRLLLRPFVPGKLFVFLSVGFLLLAGITVLL